MSKVTHYLDCGCALLEDGSRSWCPSCIDGSGPDTSLPDGRDGEAELAQIKMDQQAHYEDKEDENGESEED